MSGIKCPLCGCNEFKERIVQRIIFDEEVNEYFYECHRCSLMCGDPKRISRINIKSRVKKIDEEEVDAFWKNYNKEDNNA